MHALYMKSSTPVWIQPSGYTYRPRRGEHAWRLVDTVTGEVVDSHTPKKVKRGRS